MGGYERISAGMAECSRNRRVEGRRGPWIRSKQVELRVAARSKRVRI